MNPTGDDAVSSTADRAGDPVGLLDHAYGQVSSLLTRLDPADFWLPTTASAWCVQDVVFHLLLDTQRALITYASPTTEPADVDAASYWHAFRPGQDPRAEAAQARFVRLGSAAYGSSASLVGQWTETAAAAVRAAGTITLATRVRTQGHVLEVADFTSTLVVEACVHHLDLVAHLDAPPEPDPVVLGHTRTVLELIADEPLPSTWSDRRAVLLGTGRTTPTDRDRASARLLVSRLPLLG